MNDYKKNILEKMKDINNNIDNIILTQKTLIKIYTIKLE